MIIKMSDSEEEVHTSESNSPRNENTDRNKLNTTQENIHNMFDRDSKNTLSALWKKNGLSLDISNNNMVNDNDKTDTTTTNDDSSDFPNWMVFGSGALAIGLISALVLRKK